MFQKFHEEHDQYPEILDRAAIVRPQAKYWSWQLTVLVGLMFAMAVWFLLIACRDLTSDKVPNAVQTWVTWIGVGVGTTALASAFYSVAVAE